MDVMRYVVVIQLMVLAALKSEPITAYVEAVMVPSKPERKTLQNMAGFSISLVYPVIDSKVLCWQDPIGAWGGRRKYLFESK